MYAQMVDFLRFNHMIFEMFHMHYQLFVHFLFSSIVICLHVGALQRGCYPRRPQGFKSLNLNTLQQDLTKQFYKIKASLSPEDLETTLSTLRKIFDNIIQHPNDDKYRQIKLANKTFSSKVWRYPACEELMKMSGWVVEDDHVRLRDNSHVHIVSQLLGKKKSIYQDQVFGNVSKYSFDDYECLKAAVIQGKTSDVQALLETSKISMTGMIYCEDGSSINLLHIALLCQHIDVVELLVKGCSVDPYVADDDDKVRVLSVFTIAPQSFIIAFLRLSGVRTNVKTSKSGATLLHYATLANCLQVVRFLVEECGVDVNITDDHLHTPLHIAYMAGQTHIAEYLIQHGANVMAVNARDCTPYQYIDGIPQAILLSQSMQNHRIIHQVPGSAEFMFFINLCNMGIEYKEAVALTMQQFPSLTEDGPTQPHRDIDYSSFVKELTQYITKRSSTDQPWGSPNFEQARNLPFLF